MCPFNTDDCLIEMTAWEDLTVFILYGLMLYLIHKLHLVHHSHLLHLSGIK